VILTRRSVLAAGVGATALAALPVRAAAELDDVAIVRRAWALLHPGLLRYNSPQQMAVRFEMFESEWRASDDRLKRYLALTRLLAGLKCGHSYANFYNQNTPITDQLFGGRNKLPFQFRWIDNAMVVTGGALPRGTVVRSIDGRGTGAILKALLPLARADGSNDAKRRQLLSVIGTDEYETFDAYYPLVFPAGDTFRIDARAPDGKRIETVLPAIDLKTRQSARAISPSDKDTPQWTLVHDGMTATLTMDGWALWNSKWNWRGWLDASFEEMERRGTVRLIIDIRRNEGGDDCGNEIIARFIDSPLVLDNYVRRVRYRRVPEDLMPYCDTWNPTFKDWGKDATPFDDRFFNLKGEGDGPATISPKGPRFKGRVIVLTSAENSSATFQFANLIKSNRLGKLVGEPTGGNRRGINGGAFFFMRLPQSGLEADLPLIGYFPKTPQPDAGIMPDIATPVTARDIAMGRDAALEKVRAA
jgi:Peptidase family S41